MPFLIRIVIQRVFVASLGVLSFLGISPEVTIPTQEDALTAIEERQKTIDDFFTDENFNSDQILDALEDLKEESEKELGTRIKIAKIDESESKQQEVQKSIDEKINQIITNPPPVIPQTNTIPTPTVTTPTKPVTTVSLPQNKTEQESAKVIEESSPEPVKTILEKAVDNIIYSSSSKSELSDVVFNILCLNRVGNQISAHAGSGVVISNTGVVLTNAHVAQYFLLVDPENPNYMDCTLYRENIPSFGYKADLLYIPSQWVRENYRSIRTTNARGTGERDFGLLVITKNNNSSLSVPRNFKYANPNINYEYKIGNEIEIASYPGAPKSILDLARSVGFQFDTSFISDLYTLSSGSIDIFSTGTTSLAQKGSSGGGVFSNGNLIGTIVTTSDSGSGYRINALATKYMNNVIKNETGASLSDYASGDVLSRSASFYQNTFPTLSNLIKSAY